MAIKSAFSKEKTLGFIPLYTSSKRKIALLPNTSGAIWTHSTHVVMPVRCMIPGKRKAFIKCPDTVSCVTCPYKDKKQAPLISWDGLVETGYEPVGRAPVDEQAIAKDEYNSIKALMDAEDARIARAFEMKELQGYSVREIAAELQISQPRVYQLISRAKTIGME